MSYTRMEEYLPAIEWVKKYIRIHFGEHIASVVQAKEHWWFYNESNEPVLVLEMALLDRLLLLLQKIEWAYADKLIDKNDWDHQVDTPDWLIKDGDDDVA
jgi:hypothetical protein